jgi:hypothetical protein
MLIALGACQGAPATRRAPGEPGGAAIDYGQQALGAYETLRGLLATDRLDGVNEAAARLAAAARRCEQRGGGAAGVWHGLATSGEQLAAVAKPDLVLARRLFGDVSRAALAVLAKEPALREGRYHFSCPAGGSGEWIQVGDEAENPYLGSALPHCGTAAKW